MDAVAHRDHPAPDTVECRNGPSFAGLKATLWGPRLRDAHECTIRRTDGSTDAWCVLADAERRQLVTLGDTCAAKRREWGGTLMYAQWDQRVDERTLAWGWHAEAGCVRPAARLADMHADISRQIDREARRADGGPPDLAIPWRAQRTYEVGILAELRRDPHRTPHAERLVRRVAGRVVAIDRGLRALRTGDDAGAFAAWDPLSKRDHEFERIGAPTCMAR